MLVARLEVSPAATLTPPRPIAPAPRESAPRLAESKHSVPTVGARIMDPTPPAPPHLVPAAAETPAPGITARPELLAELPAKLPAIAPPAIGESPSALTLPPTPEPLTGSVEQQPLAEEPQAMPPDPPTDSETPRFAASTVAQGSLGLVAPPSPAPRQTLMMPAAELKAMMAAEVARRDLPVTDTPRLVEAAPPAAPASAPTPNAMAQAIAPIGDAPSGTTIDRVGQTGHDVRFDVVARVNGDTAGRLPLLITGDTISVRLGDVLALLEPMMEPAQFAALNASSGAGEYVSLNRLRASGIAVRFDARDQLILGRR
jgi:hypothetical protein